MATSRPSRLQLDAEERQKDSDVERPESREHRITREFGMQMLLSVKEWKGNVLIAPDGTQWTPEDSSVKNASWGPNEIPRSFILVHEIRRIGKNGIERCLIEHPDTPHERVWIAVDRTGTDARRRLFAAFDQPQQQRLAA